ncbi:cupin domain-containing protein [Neolewinella agarilytica]|uniref:Uncharacterized protein n=1 Tax=Neolewinella agarilytica TaxID=478744 RepID=A0A1H9KXE7_9BACT|nr:hypothetical protein [Neolewinella agarilytica]SER03615.1 hypothetical protein SAMN05444359_12226 [Neolewinella agarilytica]
MNDRPTDKASTIESVLQKLKTSVGPVTEMLHNNDSFKVILLGLNVDVLLPDHHTKLPTKLTVLKGSVVYRDINGNVPLFQYDELEIPINEIHSVQAIRPSLCLLTIG